MTDRRKPVNRLQRFTLVGTAATLVDVAVLIWLIRRDSTPLHADLVSVSLATVISHVLHRLVTVANDPGRRWYERFVGSYASTAIGSMCADVVVFTVAMDAIDRTGAGWVLVCKAMSLTVAVIVRIAAYRSILGNTIRAAQLGAHGPLAPHDGPRLSVVIPAFREEDRIAATIDAIRMQLATEVGEGELEIVVVDDGSGDQTAEAARSGGADRVVVLDHNRGKGAAVRAGMLAAHGRTRAFIDADLAYSPDQLLKLLETAEQGWDVVVGSRKHTSATTLVKAGRLRELGSRLVNLLTSVALLGQYRDTQCGLKAFSASAAERIFAVAKIDRFAMDIEVIFLVERNQMTLVEVPVQVTNSERSTVRVVRDTARLLRDVVRIRLLARSGEYERNLGGSAEQA